jgi:AcrR family transcriptional regulator
LSAPPSASRRGKQQRSSLSTEAMLNAAIELVIEHGASVSMMAIGRRSGFSHGLVMARFGSKAGLIRAVTEKVQSEFAAGVNKAIGDATGFAGLLGVVNAFFAARAETSTAAAAFYVLLGESMRNDPDLREAFVRADESFRRFVGRFLRQARDDGELDPSVSIPAAAVLIVGMLRGAAMQGVLNPEVLSADAVRRQALSFVNSLRRRSSRSAGIPEA